MAVDPIPNHTTTTPTAATTATATTTTTTMRPIRPASSPLPPNLYSAIRTQSPSASPVAQPPAHHHHHNQGLLYPVASSGRGFIPRPIRPAPTTSPATGEHPAGGGYPSRPLVNFHPPQQQSQQPVPVPMHLMRPAAYNLTASPFPPPPIKGLPLPSTPAEVAPPPSVLDSNGFKDTRNNSRDDNLSVIRGRKVRITDRASLYVHCRSWLRNGFAEEIQPQYGDAGRSLPKPSPIPMASATLPKKEEGGEEEKEKEENNEDKDEEYIERLSPHDLLKRHVKRARKVRARLREERLRRIARYKSRLALLLPPLVEQFRNDLAAGN